MHALTLGTSEIRQLDGLYSLNDLHRAAGGEKKHEPHQFMRNDQTQALIVELSSADSRSIPTKTIIGKGKQQGTYVCKELVIAYAAWISGKFHLMVIRAFLDTLPQAPALPNFITEAQAGELSALIAERFPEGKHRPYAWGRFNNHFRIARYRELPALRFDEACAYIRAMPVKDAPPQAILSTAEYRELLDKAGYVIVDKNQLAALIHEPGQVALNLLPGIINACTDRLSSAAIGRLSL